MERISINRRQDWEQKIQEQGFLFYKDYYDETAAYTFTSAEIDRIEAATIELFDRCLDVVQYVIDNELWDEFHIPRKYAPLIRWSWENDIPAFYGRFDLAVDKDCSVIKLLEFNADTPASLLETSVIQWYWLQEFNNEADQFNSIHEKMVAHMKICHDYFFGDRKLWFTAMLNSQEDYMTVKYLQECAVQAGIDTDFLYVNEIGVQDNNIKTPFCSPQGAPIHNMFKLYPYEWMFNEQFGDALIEKMEDTLWIEPPYKAILSNKMLLVYLHKLFPSHPNILEALLSEEEFISTYGNSYVRKPIFGREGSNVTIVIDGKTQETNEGEYGEEGFVYQSYFEMPKFDGGTPVIGSWLIGGESAGMGIRETTGLVHNNMSKFIPHFFTR